MFPRPTGIYINWAAYDELSDSVQLDEALAMRQLEEMVRLRQAGCRLDYYLMDAFWYAPADGYRSFRKPHWPDGPDRWLDRCHEAGILPGLWVASNNCGAFAGLQPHPAWENSLTPGRNACCMFTGGFLAHFLESLHIWYERGVRLFKFDFADLGAATPALLRTMLPADIRLDNTFALRAGLIEFRATHPEVRFLAYNGFDVNGTMDNTSSPLRKAIDPTWLTCFDAIYCGDPRPSDVPASNFWRSKDIYSDHMVRVFQASGLPAASVDNSGFMVGDTGTCYWRGATAWRGMLIMSLARGGWANTYYGNLELLFANDAAWFAKAQALFFPLQEFGKAETFGPLPGEGEPYGFALRDRLGGVVAVVNPSQSIARVAVPGLTGRARILFCDAGFGALLAPNELTLGPEQIALVGYGEFADPHWNLGLEPDVHIPISITPHPSTTKSDGPGSLKLVCEPVDLGALRFVFRQCDADGVARRVAGGQGRAAKPLDKVLRLTATQAGAPVALSIRYDKIIWSGLSWAVGEIAAEDMGSAPVTVLFESIPPTPYPGGPPQLYGQVYWVHYAS